jgi:hypothetical protein
MMSKKLFLFILLFYSNLTIFSQTIDFFEAIATEVKLSLGELSIKKM